MIRGLTDDDYHRTIQRCGRYIAPSRRDSVMNRLVGAGTLLASGVGDVIAAPDLHGLDELRHYAAWSDLLTMDDEELAALVSRLAGGCRPDLEAVTP